MFFKKSITVLIILILSVYNFSSWLSISNSNFDMNSFSDKIKNNVFNKVQEKLDSKLQKLENLNSDLENSIQEKINQELKQKFEKINQDLNEKLNNIKINSWEIINNLSWSNELIDNIFNNTQTNIDSIKWKIENSFNSFDNKFNLWKNSNFINKINSKIKTDFFDKADKFANNIQTKIDSMSWYKNEYINKIKDKLNQKLNNSDEKMKPKLNYLKELLENIKIQDQINLDLPIDNNQDTNQDQNNNENNENQNENEEDQNNDQNEDENLINENETEQLKQIRQEMIESLNSIRISYWLKPLEINIRLNNIAQNHAIYMAQTNDFSHITKDWKTPYDRAVQWWYKFSYFWENIAAFQTSVEQVMNDWMNSQWHKENILNPNYTQVWIWFNWDYRVQNFWAPK